MNEQKKLLRQIQVYCFAIVEVTLYLDGHPCDRDALEYYNKYNAHLSELKHKYESKYGPLTANGNNGCTWRWVEGPWPWEYEAN